MMILFKFSTLFGYNWLFVIRWIAAAAATNSNSGGDRQAHANWIPSLAYYLSFQQPGGGAAVQQLCRQDQEPLSLSGANKSQTISRESQITCRIYLRPYLKALSLTYEIAVDMLYKTVGGMSTWTRHTCSRLDIFISLLTRRQQLGRQRYWKVAERKVPQFDPHLLLPPPHSRRRIWIE